MAKTCNGTDADPRHLHWDVWDMHFASLATQHPTDNYIYTRQKQAASEVSLIKEIKNSATLLFDITTLEVLDAFMSLK